MKRLQKVILAIFFVLFTFSVQNSFADSTNPPNPPGEHGASQDQSGGGAPIGGGLFILLGLGAAYGSKKLYDNRKSLPVEE